MLASVVYQDDEQLLQVLEATVNGAGSAVSEVAARFDIDSESLHAQSADWLRRFDGETLFLNTVSGLGSPWWLAEPAPRFEPAKPRPAADDAIAAVLESVAFLLAVNLECMRERLGSPTHIVATGGLARVDPLLQALADLAGVTVRRAVSREATARGLAFLLAGGPASWPATVTEQEFVPGPERALHTRYRRWRSLMPPI